MTGDFELAFRHLLMTVVRDVAAELLSDRHVPDRPQPPQIIQTDDSLLITTREAAKRLSISGRTLFTLTRSGVLPCVRIGTSVRYSVETIQEWIRESEAKDQPQVTKATVSRVQTASESKVRLTPVPQLTAKQITAKKAVSATSTNQRKKRSTSNRTRSKNSESEKFQSPFSDMLNDLGVKDSSLPPLSNGDLMRIAGVDIATFHGWMYLHRELPDAALNKLREHFIAYRKGNGNANDSESNSQ